MRSSKPVLRTRNEVRAAELGQQALALRRAGRTPEALGLLREAVRLAPRHAGLVGNLGNVLLAIGERPAAMVALEHACALDPDSATLAYNLGKGLFDEGRLTEARAALARALTLGGIEAHARVNLGRIDEIEGRLEAAAEQWLSAAQAAPHMARPHYLLARVGRLAERGPLESLATAADTPAAERAEAHFGLGHAFDREGDHGRAFEHFVQANRLQKSLLPPFDPATHEAEIERLVRVFDADFFARLEPAHSSAAPLFVVGLPRSGTTLVESILAAHPEVRGCGERLEIDTLARSWRARGFPADPQAVLREERALAAQAYLSALDPTGAARRVTDKLPGNYVHLGIVAALFARARVVHCRRDPLDTALSLFVQLFEGAALPFSYDLGHIACVIRSHRRLMEHWRTCLPLARLELDYATLVGDPEVSSRTLVRFAGLEWDERCLTRKDAGTVLTASAWRVRAPVDQGSVGRWRHYAEALAPLRASLAGIDSPEGGRAPGSKSEYRRGLEIRQGPEHRSIPPQAVEPEP